MPPRISPSKLAAEFLLIFVSVILALIADDWRTEQRLIAQERNSLESMLRDLNEDEDDLLRLTDRLQEFEENAAIVLDDMIQGEPVDAETWVPQFHRATGHFLYRPVYPTYIGLRQSGQLNLIRDPALREWIVEYHDDLIGYLIELRASYDTRHDAVINSLTPYFTSTFDQDEERWRTQLIVPLESLKSDQAVRARLGLYARSVASFHLRIDGLFVPHNQRLREAIHAHLSGQPLPERIPRD